MENEEPNNKEENGEAEYEILNEDFYPEYS